MNGQRKKEGEKEEEKRKGEDVRICPLEDMRVLLEQVNAAGLFYSKPVARNCSGKGAISWGFPGNGR